VDGRLSDVDGRLSDVDGRLSDVDGRLSDVDGGGGMKSRDRFVFWNVLKDKIFLGIVILLSFFIFVPLVLILYHIIVKGIAFVNWDLFTKLPAPAGELGGGIANAIIGSLIVVALASLIAVPIGIFAGIYLSEHKKQTSAHVVRVAVDVLQGAPSIVIGIIAYVWIVVPTRSFSAFSGSAALAIMMLPVIIKNTEETLKLIPSALKEAAFALGVPYSRVILKVILPAGLSGIVTGVLIGTARVLGETAPLLFTAFGSPFMNLNILGPMETIPHVIFKYATSPYEDWQNIAWGASFILVAFILLINIIAKVVTTKWKVKF
jgi:phosphate transport system permease protein